ncbi:gliding motility protein GldN [uncultured Prevotella sp.]|uniref:type IX secretion system ring protein PorN/GldN n=1 Tax=uncultured Prevotella sp. TaxID=159272 RepID=UPI00262E2769|nr:gliding motility protein GldN [uncultured Prevotella sp.]
MRRFMFIKKIANGHNTVAAGRTLRVCAVLLLLAACMAEASAQPAARRRQQQQKNESNAQTLTTRARISYPTAARMSEDVVWRRDIYREINLEEDANAGLYYPIEPVGSQMNLFTYIFKLMMRGDIKAYEYRLDGNEVFTDSARIKPLAFLDNYHIYYERDGGRVRLDNSDIPSREVKAFYIKESTYYNQSSATFHTKVLALCPIMSREDDFGDGAQKYPLFWVRYDDLAPYLSKQIIMTSNLNNAATMSMDDYFTRNMYKGKIYKTTNMLGKTLSQYCPTDSAMAKEQKRIEDELAAFEKNIWGDQARKDSLDSIAKADVKVKDKKAKKNRRSSSTVKKSRSSSKSSSGSSPAARVTVRRQRH